MALAGVILGMTQALQNKLVYFLVIAIALAFTQSYAIKRLHDIGLTGWLSLLNFIPYLNLVFFLILLIKSGQKKKNKYGDIPKKSSFLKLFSATS